MATQPVFAPNGMVTLSVPRPLRSNQRLTLHLTAGPFSADEALVIRSTSGRDLGLIGPLSDSQRARQLHYTQDLPCAVPASNQVTLVVEILDIRNGLRRVPQPGQVSALSLSTTPASTDGQG